MISYHYCHSEQHPHCHSEQPGLPEPIRAKREKANGKLGVAENPFGDSSTHYAGWLKLNSSIRE